MTATAQRVYDYVGANSKGESRGGRGELGRTLALWVERKFDLGWRRLTVRLVDTDKSHAHRSRSWRVVAEIKTDDTGRRTWWAES